MHLVGSQQVLWARLDSLHPFCPKVNGQGSHPQPRGNQQGIEHLAEAVYDAPLADFLRSFFPSKP